MCKGALLSIHEGVPSEDKDVHSRHRPHQLPIPHRSHSHDDALVGHDDHGSGLRVKFVKNIHIFTRIKMGNFSCFCIKILSVINSHQSSGLSHKVQNSKINAML